MSQDLSIDDITYGYGTSYPENPTPGDIYFDMHSIQAYVYDGTHWIAVANSREQLELQDKVRKQKSFDPIEAYNRAMKPIRK